MKRLAILVAVTTAALPLAPGEGRGEGEGRAGTLLRDTFETISPWSPVAAEGVEVDLDAEAGALRVDFDFSGRGGWAGARRAVAVELPEHFELRLDLKGAGRPNTLEIKLIDPSGENVWWVNRKEFELPAEERTLRFKRRHFSFAWGPRGGGEVESVGAIEIVLTAGQGGRGTLWLDDLEIAAAAAPEPAPSEPPRISADGASKFLADLGARMDFGALFVRWSVAPSAYSVEGSLTGGGEDWALLDRVAATNGGDDWLYTPESEARRLRFRLDGCPETGCALASVEVLPLAAGESPNAFFTRVAANAQPGDFPRGFIGQQSYWTVVGADGAAEEGLFGEDGRLELGKGAPSLEPFLWLDGRLVAWSDVESVASLAAGRLPIPTVLWRARGAELEVTTFADGPPESSTLWARYRLSASGPDDVRARKASLLLALRPLQVNPPTQFLGASGGVARLDRIALDGGRLRWASGAMERDIALVPPPSAFGATAFDGGEIHEHLRVGRLPSAQSVEDPRRWASAAVRWDFDLAANPRRDVWIATPLGSGADTSGDGERRLTAAIEAWGSRLGGLQVGLPDGPDRPHRPDRPDRPDGLGAANEHARLLTATLGWILVHRDGPALRPGSRAYERSWIRDGALTSSALLRAGLLEEARAFVEWYAGFQYPSGAVPCCVDERGADPVPEHDSHGEWIYAVAETWRFTRDRAFLTRLFPSVERAGAHLDSLRQKRRTAEYARSRFFGLLPESISHEGYSAKPVHSYWDDFFALRGFKDAVELAQALGERQKAALFARSRDEFAADLHASIRRSIADHRIDFIPGSADLGDFDATSTTIALAPGGELERLPARELRNTFERYWTEFVARRDGTKPWDAYTPYELRNVGAFVRLGWRDRAHELLSWFMEHHRPPEWNQWAEVVGREPREPRFLGDMPHGWVGSDYIRSFLDLFAYERESDGALILGAGIPEAWLADGGCALRGLHTRHGVLDLSFERRGPLIGVRVVARAGWTAPLGGIWLDLPDHRVEIEALPATLELR